MMEVELLSVSDAYIQGISMRVPAAFEHDSDLCASEMLPVSQ